MTCQYCSQQIPHGAVACPYCGAVTPIQPTPADGYSMQYSTDYQAGYGQGAYSAPGYPVAMPGYQPVPYGVEQKSKLAGGLLNIFLPFGVGRFYLGYTTIGIAQLLVTLLTFGVGGLWGLIDGILILTGNVKVDGNGYPLKD